MSYQDTFEHILAALYDAMLDDARWPAASALIDEACGITGNDLMVGEGPKDDVQADFVGVYCRGQRREDLEREYLENYHPTDERVPRFRQLPDSRPTHVTDLYTAEELKTSPTYNEALARAGQQDAVNTRLDGPDGSHIAWALGDPVDSDGWGSSRVAMVTGLLPHIRQFVRVRQALVRAEARNTTVTALLDNPRIGVFHLDRRGHIIAANDRARSILRRGDGLSDRDGMLHARAPAEQVRLERLLGDALPASGAATVSGSMLLRRSPVLPPFVVHVKPGGRPSTGLRSAARRRAGADCRAGAPASCRSRPGGQNPGADADGDSGGGLVGGRQERARHGRGDRSHAKRHLLAPTADLPEAVHLAAGGLGAVGALARRVRVRGSAAGGGLLWPPYQRAARLDAFTRDPSSSGARRLRLAAELSLG